MARTVPFGQALCYDPCTHRFFFIKTESLCSSYIISIFGMESELSKRKFLWTVPFPPGEPVTTNVLA